MIRKAVIAILTALGLAVIGVIVVPWYPPTLLYYSDIGCVLLYANPFDVDHGPPNVLAGYAWVLMLNYGRIELTYGRGVWLTFPLWPGAALFFAYPTLALIRGPLRRHRRRKRGLCQECGYNLTGNTSGVCPECGTKISRP